MLAEDHPPKSSSAAAQTHDITVVLEALFPWMSLELAQLDWTRRYKFLGSAVTVAATSLVAMDLQWTSSRHHQMAPERSSLLRHMSDG